VQDTDVTIATALMNGLQPKFIEMRAMYEAREEPSKMFHWSIFIISGVITEILTNVMSGTLFFLPWYFVVGFWQSMTNRAARGAYQWLILVRLSLSLSLIFADVFQIMFEAWVSSFGQLLASMAPNAQVAALLIPMTFVFVALFCGVLQPLSQLPKFWRFVHYASPFTWIVEYVPFPMSMIKNTKT
jgi:ABC-type multidrug transport system permease subunit